MRNDDLTTKISALKTKHRILVRAMMQRLVERDLDLTEERWNGILSAAEGRYRYSSPITPDYFGFTFDEFNALRALIYGAGSSNPTR